VASLSRAPHGISKESLETLIAAGGSAFTPDERRDAFARFREQPPLTPVRPSRYWKHDLAKLEIDDLPIVAPLIGIDGLGEASSLPLDGNARAKRAVPGNNDPFTSLAVAFSAGGTHLRIERNSDEPIAVECIVDGGAGFPYLLIELAPGVRATVVERLRVGDGAFACGLVEIAIGDRAELHYAVEQNGGTGRAIVDRRVSLGNGAKLDAGLAELGSALSVSRFRADALGEGAHVDLAAIFFPTGDQHVDLGTELQHRVSRTTSATVVRSAAAGHGQGRYFGNIVIAAETHGCEATLRDDALLLSESSHIDSIPALEIASNDVKAYHGATVGAIGEDEIFYAQSRGIPRSEAERMIALGFFEPAIARFPGTALRERLREAIVAKLDSRP
jgi:Fe-S cluster assembly protein SufD